MFERFKENNAIPEGYEPLSFNPDYDETPTLKIAREPLYYFTSVDGDTFMVKKRGFEVKEERNVSSAVYVVSRYHEHRGDYLPGEKFTTIVLNHVPDSNHESNKNSAKYEVKLIRSMQKDPTLPTSRPEEGKEPDSNYVHKESSPEILVTEVYVSQD